MKKLWVWTSFLFRQKAETCSSCADRSWLEEKISALEQAAAQRPTVQNLHQSNGIQARHAPSAIAALLLHLPLLKNTSSGCVDFPTSDPMVLSRLSDDATTVQKIVQRGISSLGCLLAYAGPQIEDGSVSADAVEDLGMFLMEMGELSAMLVNIQSNCRLGNSGLNAMPRS